MASVHCKECGCKCSKCMNIDHDIHLHAEIETLKQQIVEKNNHIVTMETNFLNEANKYPNGELLALHDELLTWQDKYKRLYDAHRRVQRVNQGLEDKLLRLVDISETDKNNLTKDVATLSHKLAEANYTIKKLTEDNERYKNDVSLAIQFLQCKPGNFVSQKFDTLPNEVQAKVSNYMGVKRKTEEKKAPPEIKSIKVPIPTFPPTAMVYSVPKSQSSQQMREEHEAEGSVDIVSAAIMAKVLEERERERSCVKHCDTCTCSNQIKIIHDVKHHSIATQTTNASGSGDNSLCLQCNVRLERNSISLIKTVSNAEANKNKTMPVYIHDYNEQNIANIAKVQPNNFLNDNNECSKLRKENANSINKLGSVRIKPIQPPPTNNDKSQIQVAHDLIDLNTSAISTTNATANETIYFANERTHSKSFAIKAHEKPTAIRSLPTMHHAVRNNFQQLNITQMPKPSQTLTRNILFDSTTADLSSVLIPTSIAPKNCTPSSISSGDHSELTFSEATNSANSIENNQRVTDWIECSSNLTPTANIESYATDCSESLISSQSHNERKLDNIASITSEEFQAHNKLDKRINIEDDALNFNIDKTKYKEMEDHVKKFLFGEYTILSEVKKRDLE